MANRVPTLRGRWRNGFNPHAKAAAFSITRQYRFPEVIPGATAYVQIIVML